MLHKYLYPYTGCWKKNGYSFFRYKVHNNKIKYWKFHWNTYLDNVFEITCCGNMITKMSISEEMKLWASKGYDYLLHDYNYLYLKLYIKKSTSVLSQQLFFLLTSMTFLNIDFQKLAFPHRDVTINLQIGYTV